MNFNVTPGKGAGGGGCCFFVFAFLLIYGIYLISSNNYTIFRYDNVIEGGCIIIKSEILPFCNITIADGIPPIPSCFVAVFTVNMTADDNETFDGVTACTLKNCNSLGLDAKDAQSSLPIGSIINCIHITIEIPKTYISGDQKVILETDIDGAIAYFGNIGHNFWIGGIIMVTFASLCCCIVTCCGILIVLGKKYDINEK